MARIILRDVCVDFPLLQEESRSLKRLLSSPHLPTKVTLDSRRRAILRALRGINYTFDDGARVALIGGNGAGKSTLLRVIAGVYPPTSGECIIEGTVGALLTVGLGMRDDVSGYDNIRFCLMLLNVPNEAIEKKTKEISEFTDLGDYLSIHVGAYSSGMRTRLAFAIATAIEPDILILDEVFGAGDAAFKKKAEERALHLVAQSRIVVFASHENKLVERLCDQAIWLDNGVIQKIGPTREIVDSYMQSVGLSADNRSLE
jgi:ABC-type polysaccharide/polyol phosphate transport system ATPase subunit